MKYFKLSNGALMPAVGCGTVNFGRENGDYDKALTDDFSAVSSALEAGYRLFDTALAYGNEEGIGKVIAESGIKREELFLSSKVPNKKPYNLTAQSVRESVEESLRRMRTDYFDMMLIHHAVSPDDPAGSGMNEERIMMIWDELSALVREGKLRGVGLSNFDKEHVEFILKNCSVKPMINQIRCNPASPNNAIISYCKKNGILPEAHSPLNFTRARGKKYVDPQYMQHLTDIGEKHSKSWAQVLLRFNFQNGLVSVPGSAKLSHQRSNLDIFDFALSAEEMATLVVKD